MHAARFFGRVHSLPFFSSFFSACLIIIFMNERMEKSFMTKIYIVIFLVMAIIAVLLYLIFSGGAERLAHRPSQTSDP